MRLAADIDTWHAAGAELAAVSVDGPERQAAMARRWGFTHIRFEADPGGERILAPLGLFDPGERGGIALGALVLLTPDGTEAGRWPSRDFADRTHDAAALDALRSLGLPPVHPPPWEPPEVPTDQPGAFSPRHLAPYFRGNLFGALAIGMRVADKQARAVATEHRHMSRSTLEAWKVWRHRVPEV